MNDTSLKERLLKLKDVWMKQLSFDIIITRKCNCDCLHCLHAQKNGVMDLKLFRTLIDELDELGITSVNLNGGEIFLHNNIREIIEIIGNHKNIKASLVTNGTLIDDEMIKYIKRANIPLAISIDGPEEFHDKFRAHSKAFRKAVHSINLAKDNDVPVTIISSIFKDNFEYIDWLIGFCLYKNVKALRVQPVETYGKAVELAKNKKLLNQKEKDLLYRKLSKTGANLIGRLRIVSIGLFRSDISIHKCKFGLCFGEKCHNNSPPWPRSMTITPEGNLYPMSSYMSKKLCIGDIKNGMKNVIDKYYASSSHIGLLRFLEKVYIEEIESKDYEYLDRGAILAQKLNNLGETTF